MPPAQLDEMFDQLRDETTYSVLRAYGVRRVVTATDVIDGVEGTSVYLVVDPELWAQVQNAPELGVPWRLTGLYAEVGMALLRYMRERDIRWISNEVLGSAFLGLEKGAAEPDGYSTTETPQTDLEAATGPRKSKLGHDAELDGLLMLGFRMAIMDRCGEGPYEMFEHSGLADAFQGYGSDFDPETWDDAELDRLEAVSASDGHTLLNVLRVYPWWEPPDTTPWAQLTVVPSDDPDTMTDEQLMRAVTLTRFGWNLIANAQLGPEVEEVRRHLASPAAVLDIEQ